MNMEKWNLDGVLNIYADLSRDDCTAIAEAVAASKYGLRQIQFARRRPVSRLITVVKKIYFFWRKVCVLKAGIYSIL